MVSVLATLLAVAPAALAATIVNDADCDCYVTNGTRPTYYKGHMFWDFRSLRQYVGTPEVIKTVQGNLDADFTSPYFDYDSPFGKVWGVQSWPNNNDEGVPMYMSKNNVYIEANTDDDPQSDTFLTMRTARLPKFQTAAEFESISNYKFASMRYFVRTTGDEGACTAMFTYRDAPKLKDRQETDIEFLTSERGHNIVHYTNQPAYLDDGEEVPGSSLSRKMPRGQVWSNWGAHRLDWTPGMTVWSVNGEETANLAFQTPRDASKLMFNAWSDGMPGWTGEMKNGGAAYQHIQWIQILHGEASKSSCSRVCSIDLSPELGKAVRV